MNTELKDTIDPTAEKATLEQLVAQRTPLEANESAQKNTSVEEPKQDDVATDQDDTGDTASHQKDAGDEDAQSSDGNSDQGDADTTLPETDGVIDLVKKLELEEKFNALLLNLRFWGNENRITRLEAALVLPEYDDASMRMFFNSAKDELLEEEFMLAMKEKRVPVEPTREKIVERAEFKHHEKYVLEPAKKAEKEAKKAAKKK